jgi:hypothetical protein
MKIKKIQELLPPSNSERHLRAEVQRLQSILDSRKRDSGHISEAMAEVLEAVKIAEPPELVYTPQSGRTSSPVTHVVHLTDWHIGEVVRPEYVEEFGVANYAVACERINKLKTNVIHKTDLTRHAYEIKDCHIIGTADWISGDIHEELIRTNEFPAPVQAVKSGFLLGQFIAGLSPHFETVHVDLLTAGNHDRITKKPQSSEGGINSWGYVVCEIARQHVSACKNVKIKIHHALSTVIQVSSQKYLIAHGDGIKGTWGIPFYGIERKKQKEAMARMNMETDKHFDKIIIGHFHTALNHEHWLIGGSLTGTNEFDHKEGRHSKPHQSAWMVHAKHGEFDFSRWWL